MGEKVVRNAGWGTIHLDTLAVWKEEAERISESKKYRGSLEAEWAVRALKMLAEIEHFRNWEKHAAEGWTKAQERVERLESRESELEHELAVERFHSQEGEDVECPVCTHLMIESVCENNNRLYEELDRVLAERKMWADLWQKASMGVLTLTDERENAKRYREALVTVLEDIYEATQGTPMTNPGPGDLMILHHAEIIEEALQPPRLQVRAKEEKPEAPPCERCGKPQAEHEKGGIFCP